MKIKIYNIFLVVFVCLGICSPSFSSAADCQAIKKSLKKERNHQKKRTIIAGAILQCPEDPVLNFKYALSLERFRKYDKALGYYQKATLYDPKMGKAHAGMGDIYIYKERLNKAIEAYQKAAKLMPGNNRTEKRLFSLEIKRKAMEGEVLTVEEIIQVMARRGKISSNMSLLLTGPVLQYRIAFIDGTTNLTPTGNRQIIAIGQALQNDALKDISFEISVHVESDASSLAALEDSKMRAKMIKDRLVANFQIAPKRLIIAWHGDTQPLESSEFTGKRSLNERVEFKRTIK